MANRGKLLILFILGVAVLAATFAWWHQYQQGQRVLGLWGADATFRIRLSPQCQLLMLAPSATADSQPITIGQRPWFITDTIDISDRPGLVHARQALIQDASYDWGSASSIDLAAGNWAWGLQFDDPGEGRTRLVLDLDRHWIADPSQSAVANIRPISDGLQTFLREIRDE